MNFTQFYEVLMNFLRKNRRRILLYAIDMGLFTALYLIHYLTSHLSDTGNLFEDFGLHALNFGIFFVCITASRLAIRTYHNVWRYANCKAYIELVIADAIGSLVAYVITSKEGDFCR